MDNQKKLNRKERTEENARIIKERYESIYNEFNLVSQSALNYTIVLFRIGENKFPEILGSGIIFKLENDVFITSAGHLLNKSDFDKGLYFRTTSNHSFALRGKLITSFESQNTNSTIDISVLKLNERIVETILNLKLPVLGNRGMLINHTPSEGERYFLSGYPLNWVKLTKKKKLIVYDFMPYKLLTLAFNVKNANKYKFDYRYHFFVHFRKKSMKFNTTNQTMNPVLRGMSGSGIWFCPDWNDKLANGIPYHFLIGILVENHSDKGYLVSIKSDLVVFIVKNFFGLTSLNDSQYNYHLESFHFFITEK